METIVRDNRGEYIVRRVYHRGEVAWTCTCPIGQRGRPCRHIAIGRRQLLDAMRAEMAAARERLAAAQAAQAAYDAARRAYDVAVGIISETPIHSGPLAVASMVARRARVRCDDAEREVARLSSEIRALEHSIEADEQARKRRKQND